MTIPPRERVQAEAVTAWFVAGDNGPDCDGWIYVGNASGGVIYDVLVVNVNSRYDSGGESAPEAARWLLSSLPPGVSRVGIPMGWRGMHFVPSVDLHFRDSAGRFWFRSNRGALSRRDKSAMDQLVGGQPLTFDEAEWVRD